ncbi:Gti1/Pac2 family-domain-containing protein [Dactylonectria macrodidyma]|uniref:Gti1/Pac2 family-domain-containing protein n=1 Tax=Dactylonectria macrodidyma TaxID=307937 RepID=A0A9P9DPA6_9HYPO|nr:Gti1/Pac2 family-domain-containing protein [Dactylonectria macrodidyma]
MNAPDLAAVADTAQPSAFSVSPFATLTSSCANPSSPTTSPTATKNEMTASPTLQSVYLLDNRAVPAYKDDAIQAFGGSYSTTTSSIPSVLIQTLIQNASEAMDNSPISGFTTGDSPPNPPNPTFEGHISSTIDALILFEACLSQQLDHVPRRPEECERQDLIKTGNAFIYDEHASGVKRWTDSVSWSPSRILGNFLIYHELEKPFPRAKGKRVLNKSKKAQQSGISKTDSSRPTNGMPYAGMSPSAPGKDADRALINSLIKSYYKVEDVMSGRLITPSKHPNLRAIIPRSELLTSQNFGAPRNEVECNQDERYTTGMSGALSYDYGSHAGRSILQRAMSLPNFPNV